MQTFQTILEAYGVDYEGTMRRVMHNQQLYLKLLDMLLADDNLGKLGEALRQDDRRAAFEAAHTLKGMTGNMGLTPLYQAVCALTEPLRAGEARDDYPELYQAVAREFEKIAPLRQALGALRQ